MIDKLKELFIEDPSYFDNFITVDVGINTGVCIFSDRVYSSSDQFSVDKKLKNDEARISYMAEQFSNFLFFHEPSLVIIEGVSYWGNSLKSNVATKTGANFLLAYIVGAYSFVCNLQRTTNKIILAQDWKGQLPDQVVKQRVEDSISKSFKKSHQHEVDAIGMGLSILGKF